MSQKNTFTPTPVKKLYVEGKRLKEIADLTGGSRSTVRPIVKKWKDTGYFENLYIGRPATCNRCDANRLKRIYIN